MMIDILNRDTIISYEFKIVCPFGWSYAYNKKLYDHNNSLSEIWHMSFVTKNMSIDHDVSKSKTQGLKK